jgi:hypothetical protein
MVYIFKNLKQEDNALVQPQSLKSVIITPGKHNYNVQHTHKHTCMHACIHTFYLYCLFSYVPGLAITQQNGCFCAANWQTDKILNTRLGGLKAEMRCYRQ